MKDYVSTKEFAYILGCTAESIRVRLCKSGSFLGIKPKKLPNRRLLWPINSINSLLDEDHAQKN